MKKKPLKKKGFQYIKYAQYKGKYQMKKKNITREKIREETRKSNNKEICENLENNMI
jgi:hypothetical protein